MKFFSVEHESFFNFYRTRYAYDLERLSALYVIGLSPRLLSHISELMDSFGCFTTNFSFPWMTGSDKRLYLLALNLYNGFVVSDDPYTSTPKYLLCFDPVFFLIRLKHLEYSTECHFFNLCLGHLLRICDCCYAKYLGWVYLYLTEYL